MEYYLLHLSYSSTGWRDIIDKSDTFDRRLDVVRKLIAHLGGSFASFHFYDTPHFNDPGKKHIVTDKFARFDEHDVMAVLAMPTKQAAQAFTIALHAQPGIESIELVSMMPFEEAVTASVAASKAAIAATGYAGPGSPKP